jgi:hypothetical protein
MGTEADVLFSDRGPEWTTRNGYRARAWHTRTGTIELAIPKLRIGSLFPDGLLERRRRAGAGRRWLGGVDIPLPGRWVADMYAGPSGSLPSPPACPTRRARTGSRGSS